MTMRKLRILFIALGGFLLALPSQAQFENFLKGGVEDANRLFNAYMTPFLKGVGYGFNNGWYNTAKPHETLGFDLTLSLNAAIVPVADQWAVKLPSGWRTTLWIRTYHLPVR